MNLIEKLKAEFAKIEDVFGRWTHHVDPEQALKDSTKSFAAATTDAVSDLHDRVAKLEGKADAPKPAEERRTATPAQQAENDAQMRDANIDDQRKPAAEKSEGEKSHTEE